MPRVLILDPLSEEGIRMLNTAGLEVEQKFGLKGSELREALGNADGAICRSGVKLTKEVLEGNRRLRVIVRAGVGVDNIDLEAATREGIIVMNTPGANTIATAEHTIALMLALARKICPANTSLQQGRWERHRFLGKQLYGKVLGIVGLGRVGRAVAERANGLGMKVLAFDPFVSAAWAREWGVEMLGSLDELLPQVDFLSLHVPLTEQTRHMIGRAELRRLKPGAYLINCSRGGVVDEVALHEVLRDGHLAGAALDVFEREPCTSHPLFGLENVVCTPHLGASTQEAQEQVAIEAAELIMEYFGRGVVKQAVNAVAIAPEVLRDLFGFLNVAYRLGLLLAQVQGDNIGRCRVRVEGEVARRDVRLLTAAVAAGLLERVVDEPVNLVNAEWLLRQRGVQLVEERSAQVGDFSSLIHVELDSPERRLVAAGTLFGNLPRLVHFRDCRLESPLEGIMMLITLHDRPGVIGKIGTIFGSYRVNIAQMTVGRNTDQPGGEQVAVLLLDEQPPPEALTQVREAAPIHSAQIVRLPGRYELPWWLRGLTPR
ncbi:MAG: phosphoglycerate dehydrogenase [Thermoguttaceae bacterium]|nr:phosphoglycerate dehydrogenase [Thermoguttaceae bacterium]MDW8078233.1 phosphoglycerate dehydrogenase [Thermoguttaceae bacterium]